MHHQTKLPKPVGCTVHTYATDHGQAHNTVMEVSHKQAHYREGVRTLGGFSAVRLRMAAVDKLLHQFWRHRGAA